MDIKLNKLGNTKNRAQGTYKKVLCVCSAGLLRSPTAAWMLSNDPWNFNTRAVGIAEDYALTDLEYQHLAWADEIVVMDIFQKNMVLDLVYRFNLEVYEDYKIKAPLIHVLDVPDFYGYRESMLVDALNKRFLEIF